MPVNRPFSSAMKALFSFCLLSFAIVSMAVSCSTQQDTIQPDGNPSDLVSFQFDLLNEQGKPDTVFREGENFSFRFFIINRTDQQLALPNPFFDAPEFCRVYQTDVSEAQSKEFFVGRPWQSMLCNERGAYPLFPKDTLKLSIKWNPKNSIQENAPFIPYFCFPNNYQNPPILTKGNYVTRFETKFKILPWEKEWVITESKRFEIKFKVK